MTRGVWPGTCLALLSLAAVADAQTYCVPFMSGYSCSAGDEYIQNVTFGSINNTSSCIPPPGYENFTTTVAPVILVPGATMPIAVTVGSFWSSDHIFIYLDADADGTFLASELLTVLTTTANGSGTGSQVLTGSVQVPSGVMPGLTTRLRFLLFFGPPIYTAGSLACTGSTYGNTEDYSAVFAGTFMPPYQVNHAGASCSIDGLNGTALSPVVITRCTGAPFSVSINSNAPGNAWDMAYSSQPLVAASGGGVALPGGQVVNLDLASSAFLFGGFQTSFAPATIPVIAPPPAGMSIQMAVVSPGSPDGVWLSQPTRLTTSTGGTVPGPVGDNAIGTVALGGPPGCGPGSITFYNVVYTTMVVMTNGRVMFGGGNFAYTPSPTAAATERASVGCWADFSTIPSGSINVDFTVPGVVAVNYVGVSYSGQPTTSSTFAIVFDTTTGFVTLNNLNGLALQTGLAPYSMWTGISPGVGGSAFNAGPTSFAPGASGIPGNSFDEIYRFGQAPQTGGCTSIFFIPVGNGYVWASI